MAKRKTIRVNPLDALVSDPTAPRTGESPATAKSRSAGPASVIAQTATLPDLPGVRNSNASASDTQGTQPLSQTDLLSRVQSLEEQNEYTRWLIGAAIVLALLL